MNHNTPAADDAVSNATVIWRYMSFEKFKLMLANRSLWFAKAALFLDDPYEAFSRALSRKDPSDDHALKCILHECSGVRTAISLERMFFQFSEASTRQFENAREHLYVNSWCFADESMGMWDLYGSCGKGIAIRSSVGQYRNAARFTVPTSHYDFGKVEYHRDVTSTSKILLDLTEGCIPLPGPGLWERMLKIGFQKRTCFEHKKEWRSVLYQDLRPEGRGCTIDFDLDELIDTVWIGPRAEESVLHSVASLMLRVDLRKPLMRSTLLCPPPRNVSASGSRAISE